MNFLNNIENNNLKNKLNISRELRTIPNNEQLASNPNYTSLATVYDLYTTTLTTYEDFENEIYNEINKIIAPDEISFTYFDFYTEELIMAIYYKPYNLYSSSVEFKVGKKIPKKHSKLCLTETNSTLAQNYFNKLYSIISQYFYTTLQFKIFNSSETQMDSSNLPFKVIINDNAIAIQSTNNQDLKFKFPYRENNKSKILKNIFVNIADCPTWCQKKLLEIRKNELKTQISPTLKLKNTIK